RSILEQGWGMFHRRLTDKAINAITPVEVIAINPTYTSLRCSRCGHTDNADVNAAKNIIAAGLAFKGRGGTSHAVP
ncbi:zinc ribbon domain-containing protein, partial [Ferrimicrobium acidiphilum]|uniref:zinc ribbon domain-containing protein n=1 Tax=Ferrimicrobium acidiphilum TaxID=121039 RepID=UPI0023F216A3